MKKFIIFLTICWSFASTSQTVSQRADSLILKFPEFDEDKRGRALLLLTSDYMVQNIDTALSFVKRIEDYGISKKDTILLITSKALHAEYFWRKGDYQKGIEYALESVDLSSTNKRFEKNLGQGYQTAGTIHLYLNNREDALNYYRKAGEVYLSINKLVSLASIYNNSGVVYMDAADIEDNPAYLDSALTYFNKVFEIKESTKLRTLLNALGNTGTIYVIRKDWEKAQAIYQEWEELEASEPNPTARSMHYGSIGLMHLELGKLDKALYYLSEGLELSKQFDSKFEMQEYHLYLSELFEKENKFHKALLNARKGWALKDSIFNAEKVNAINELEEKYQTAERERKISEANSEIERKERFQTFLFVIIGLILVFSTIGILLLMQRFRLKRALLSQEIDTLRVQINSIFGGGKQKLDLTLDQINEGLFKPLSEREFEILNEAISDKTNGEIAEAVFVSVNTVKTHLKNVYTKLGVSNRKEALEVLLAKA